MSVRAKFKVESVGPQGDTFEVKLTPVIGGNPENDSFFKYTPGGEIRLAILKEETAGKFEVGKEYYVDFSEVS